MQVKTVKIANPDAPDGHTIINESDFDPEKHSLHGAEQSKMSVGELRDALAAKGIEIPEGSKKADLQALFDASNE